MLGKTVLDFLGSLFGGGMSYASQREANMMNMKMQYDFAQRGIQMKVADAKQAGIHPLYALGAVTHSPSVAMQAESGLGRGISDALKGLGANLSVERKLQQELLRSQIGENMSDILLKTEKRKKLMEEDKDMLNDAKSRIGQDINSQQDTWFASEKKKWANAKKDNLGRKYLEINLPMSLKMFDKGPSVWDRAAKYADKHTGWRVYSMNTYDFLVNRLKRSEEGMGEVFSNLQTTYEFKDYLKRWYEAFNYYKRLERAEQELVPVPKSSRDNAIMP